MIGLYQNMDQNRHETPNPSFNPNRWGSHQDNRNVLITTNTSIKPKYGMNTQMKKSRAHLNSFDND